MDGFDREGTGYQMSTILERIKNRKDYNPKNSAAWFMKNVNSLSSSGFKQMDFLGENRSKQVRQITPSMIGSLCQFFYSPKTKETLPVYDTFPLILPFNYVNGHIYGLNIHYMHPKFRLIAFDKLASIVGNESTRKQLTWRFIKGLANVPQLKNCVKQYIPKHIKSNIIVFGEDDYVPAIFLPSHSFKKLSADEVWSS